MAYYNAFAHKWDQVTSGTLPTPELQRVLKRKPVDNSGTPDSSNKRTRNHPRETSFKSRLPKECNLTTSIENVYLLAKDKLNYWSSQKKRPKYERNLG